MTIPALTFPDATLLTVEYLRTELAGLSTVTYPSLLGFEVHNKLTETRPLIRVGRVGGVREGFFDNPRLLVESWATHSLSAAANLDVVRDLLWRIPGSRDGFNVSGFVEVGGPSDLADPETGSPRYLLTVAFRVRGNART